jgi:hypothetical protein
MSHSSDGGYNGLKAFAFTVGVTVLIFTVLYVARRYNPNIFGQEPFSRSYSWYLRGPNDPPQTASGRQSLGERPRMWDIWIASWYPPCPRPESPSEALGFSQRQPEGENCDVRRAADGEGKQQWTEFLVSRVLVHTSTGAHACVSGCPATVCSQAIRLRYCRFLIQRQGR